MKITYMIRPFSDGTNLIHCVNSLLRQTDKDIDIIIAENAFGEHKNEVDELVRANDNVRAITPNGVSGSDKIKEAVSLSRESGGDYLAAVSADSTAVPAAAGRIKAAAKNADIVYFDGYTAYNGEMLTAGIDGNNFYQGIDLWKAENFCVSKKFISGYPTDPAALRCFLLSKITQGANIAFCDIPCFYGKAEEESFISADRNRIYDEYQNTFRLAAEKHNKKAIVSLINFYAGRLLMTICGGDEPEIKEEAFAFLKKMGEEASRNEFAKECFINAAGTDYNGLCGMDRETYSLFRSGAVFGERSRTAPVTAASAPAPKPAAAPSGGRTGMQNPVIEIPQMFAEGKLGMKVILRSCSGWLNHKMRGKK